jgi:membrane associated rhomboid family serine protease
MGLSDRDYIRIGPRASSGLGNLRVISFNTWLIILNVAVFVLNNMALSAPDRRIRVELGREYLVGVTQQQREREVVLDTQIGTHTNAGWFYHPIVDPNQAQTDRYGRPIIDAATGRPYPREIGRVRFTTMAAPEALGHFSTGKGFIPGFQVWRFVSFQFLHYNFVHLLFNMLGLWFVGGLVEQYLGFKRYAAFYLVCGIFGAILYLALNFMGYVLTDLLGFEHLRLPGLLFNDIYTPLIGASAGVFGVLVAAAFIEPRAIVYVMFAIPMRLRTAVYLLMTITLVNLLAGKHNAGGEAAHVGGALAGYYFIRHTHLLRDFFDIFGNSHRPRSGARTRQRGGRDRWEEEPDTTTQVDRILEKVSREGIDSLTDAEKRALQRASEGA